jgi:hypothetical protein
MLKKLKILLVITLTIVCTNLYSILNTSISDQRTIETFYKKYPDNPTGVNHSSKCAITIETEKKSYTLVLPNLYVAKGSDYCDSRYIACKLKTAVAGKPSLHSEIAFIQDITSNSDPVNDSIAEGSLINKRIKWLLSEKIIKITLIIKNSQRLPCSDNDHDYRGTLINWGPGIRCDDYLQQFCNKICQQYGVACSITVQAPSDMSKTYSSS